LQLCNLFFCRKKHEKFESKHNSLKYEIVNEVQRSPNKEDLQKMLQEALTTIADLNKKIARTESNTQSDKMFLYFHFLIILICNLYCIKMH